MNCGFAFLLGLLVQPWLVLGGSVLAGLLVQGLGLSLNMCPWHQQQTHASSRASLPLVACARRAFCWTSRMTCPVGGKTTRKKPNSVKMLSLPSTVDSRFFSGFSCGRGLSSEIGQKFLACSKIALDVLLGIRSRFALLLGFPFRAWLVLQYWSEFPGMP